MNQPSKKFVRIVSAFGRFSARTLCLAGVSILACSLVSSDALAGLYVYADFSILPDQPTKAFDLLLSNGENGFQKGLYVSTDFVGPQELLRVDGPNQISVVKDGIGVNESLIFAQGSYRTGMFITQPNNLSIVRLLSDGTLTTFANLRTGPLGPSGMAYAPDGTLLVTNAYGGNILRVNPDGSSSVFATLPGAGPEARPFGITTLPASLAAAFGGPILVGTFETPLEVHNDKIYVFSADGQLIKEVAQGLDHLEYINPSPGLPYFEPGVFLSEFGTDVNGSGRVSLLEPDGTIIPLLSGLNPASVVFDTQGILFKTPTMCIADMNANIINQPEPSGSLSGRIDCVPEPGSLTLFAVSIFGFFAVRSARRTCRIAS